MVRYHDPIRAFSTRTFEQYIYKYNIMCTNIVICTNISIALYVHIAYVHIISWCYCSSLLSVKRHVSYSGQFFRVFIKLYLIVSGHSGYCLRLRDNYVWFKWISFTYEYKLDCVGLKNATDVYWFAVFCRWHIVFDRIL